MNMETYLSPLVGYRGWRVGRYDTRFLLQSYVSIVPWLPREPTRADTCPHFPEWVEGCQDCGPAWYYSKSGFPTTMWIPPLEGMKPVGARGIHAYKTLELAETETRDAGANMVYGEVWLWGKVEIRELGFRATMGYPKKLYCPSLGIHYAATIHALAQNYGCAIGPGHKEI